MNLNHTCACVKVQTKVTKVTKVPNGNTVEHGGLRVLYLH
jgi:hypothetical protein